MNPVEIEDALLELAAQPFDAAEFPYAFLRAFGNPETTIKRLRAGASNQSDVPGGVLQRSNVHIAVAEPGRVSETLAALRASPKTAKAKAKFIVATDGVDFGAENLLDDDSIECGFASFAERFSFFLPLAGITTVAAIKDNPIDIKATGRLNKLYLELLKENPDWASDARRHEFNQFMARLIFCFFAEDTGIFSGQGLFTRTVETYSDRDNAHEIIRELFLAMDLPTKHDGKPDDRYRKAAGIRNWADAFPYVNGGLFAGTKDVPRFSRQARNHFFHAGRLDWKAINPDIFGSMIQGIADDKERESLGMHYTSVPNILKVLNPLFLDDLRQQLTEAGDSPVKLLNLRRRLARIRVFDPACGSGNFLVIAYKEMRAIEAEIIRRRMQVLSERQRREEDTRSVIPLKNFYGIEIKDFACEIARLSLLIAEYQCDVSIMGQERAGEIVLPLKETGKIVCDNALRIDWLTVCPPAEEASLVEHDLAGPTGRLALDGGAASEKWETYVCGNPPYAGKGKKTKSQIAEMEQIFSYLGIKHGYIDYVASWFAKFVEIQSAYNYCAAFVATNSICQGHQVPPLWPHLLASDYHISFAHTSFKWANLATNVAGVTVVIIGLSSNLSRRRRLFSETEDGSIFESEASFINAYLIPGVNTIVEKRSSSISSLPDLDLGNMPYDGGNLLLTSDQMNSLELHSADRQRLTRRIAGSNEYVNGLQRHCLWIQDDERTNAEGHPDILRRILSVRKMRSSSTDAGAQKMAQRPHQLREMHHASSHSIVVPRTSSETRAYLPVGLLDSEYIVSSEAFWIRDAPLWNMALIASRLHLVWIATVCGKLETRYRYSNTLGWNTFPVPPLTENQKAALTRCAEEILLAREHYFPATIADMYEPDRMDEEFPLVREAHERNDETLERIYMGRRFRNDTERLEKLFEMYVEMTKKEADAGGKAPRARGRKKPAS